MKHKISFTILAAVLLISMLFTGGAAYAQDETLPNPGITPDSPFYFFDKLGKNLGMAFAFGNEAKANKALQYAEERLAEARAMASENNTEAMERAIADYESLIARIQDKMAKLEGNGRSDNISERVALATTNHLEVLERVREQVSERAREAIANAENVSINGQINALRALGQNRLEKALEICDNITIRQMEKIRIRANTNANTENGTSANLTALLNYADRIAALEDEMTEIAESLGINITAMQARLAASTTNRLQVLSEVYEKVPAQAQSGIANAIENSVRKYEMAVERLQTANVASPVSINATLDNIPDKLKERIRLSINSRLQINDANSENGTQLSINTQTREQLREQMENHLTDVPPAGGNAIQTEEQKETGNGDNSNGGKR